MIHIVEEVTDEDRQLQEEFGRHGSVHYATPDEAVGEIVQFERPGTRGIEPYQITSVDLENKVTILKNLLSGIEIRVEDDFLPPNYTAFPRVEIGEEFSTYWLEHQKGNGGWVQTTPNLRDSRAAQKYYGLYTGHEKIRVCSKSYKHIPSGVLELHIWSNSNGECKVYYEDEIDTLDEVFEQIDAPSAHTTIGQLYVNQDDKIVSMNIAVEYREPNFTPMDIIQ